MQMQRPIPEPQCNISFTRVAFHLLNKMPKSAIFSRDSTQMGEVLFEQWAFKVKSVLQSHMETTLREGKLLTLCRAVADPVWYLSPQAPMSGRK